ncbi:MAG: hypothetical protein E6729_07400 [Finegoldia magna]|nr:hypothetical protein [Finegoldia magna]
MEDLKQLQINEAIKRMKLIRIFDKTIDEFKEEGTISKSIRGGLYWIDNDDEKRVQEFEEKYNAVVYSIIENNTEFGKIQALFYVSKNVDEWNLDVEDLENGISNCYVYNLDCPEFSEFGAIGFRNVFGGLIREY